MSYMANMIPRWSKLVVSIFFFLVNKKIQEKNQIYIYILTKENGHDCGSHFVVKCVGARKTKLVLFHTCNDDLGQGLDTCETHAVKDLANGELQERLGRTFDDQAHEVRGESIGQRSGTAKDVRDFGVEGHQSG